MQAVKKNLSDTKIQLTLVADVPLLERVKQEALDFLGRDLKLAGFRPGKAPAAIVEKNVNPASLQSEFLDRALNAMYGQALEEHDFRPVAPPDVKVTKFVPFETVEMEATVDVIGAIKLPDYKTFKLEKKTLKVTTKDIDGVLDELKKREAEKKDVDRPAKAGDQTTIDFKGVDAKTKEPINGADGKDYPLLLGSNTFIPGFEDNLLGMKTGEEKTFVLTFPKEYGVKALQSRKVEFTIKVSKVQEVVSPKIDDEFAAKVGPFKTVAELKDDVKKQLESEKQYEEDRAYADELITKLTEATKVAIPDSLIDEQIERLLKDQRQNLMYRGQTWQEFLEAQGTGEDDYKKSLRPEAELRVKAGLMISEVAEQEKIDVAIEELEAQLQALRGRYPDAKMQSELDKPESRREIASRMMSEKTINKLVEYATASGAKTAKK